ncbi:MAG: STAS domain-containing protein [Candidatus Wallbacteria bacterium]|nr:STAS domain-containing protein [Candidatus Wallbacteria bacterium]
MAERPFISETKHGDVRLVALGANLTYANYRQLKDTFERLQGTNEVAVVLDLHDCGYMDSAGLGLLASFVSSFRQKGGDIRLLRVPGPLKDTLQITKLIKFFKLYADEEDALKSYSLDASPVRGV